MYVVYGMDNSKGHVTLLPRKFHRHDEQGKVLEQQAHRGDRARGRETVRRQKNEQE